MRLLLNFRVQKGNNEHYILKQLIQRFYESFKIINFNFIHLIY